MAVAEEVTKDFSSCAYLSNKNIFIPYSTKLNYDGCNIMVYYTWLWSER